MKTLEEKLILTQEEKLIDFLNEKEMYLKKADGLHYIETFQGQQVTDPMPFEEVYQLADEYLQNYVPGEEAVPVFMDIEQEEDRSDMTFEEIGEIVDRFREMTSENRIGVVALLARICTMIDREEKEAAKNE